MAIAFTAIVALGTLATIVGLIGLALGSRGRDEVNLERKLASHRRRTLIRMWDNRSVSPR